MNGSSISPSSAAAAVAFTACFLLQRLTTAAVVEITSSSETLKKDEGETVQLVCEFVGTEFNLFDHPVVWHKLQRLHHHGDDGDEVYNESSQINMMGSVLAPFSATKRFKPTFSSSPPSYRFALTITDLSAADVGNYSCRIGGPQNTLVASVTHQLLVRADVDYLLISDDAGGRRGGGGGGWTRGAAWPTTVRHKPRLVYVAGRPSTLRCVVVGGRPTPSVRVRVDRRPQEDAGRPVSAPSMTLRVTSRREGERGLRVLRRATQLVSLSTFVVDVDDDDAVVTCEATVDGLPPRLATATISVLYVMVLGCINATAAVGQRNVYVSCELRSRPDVVQLYWVIDDNGTTVAETQIVREYWTLLMDRMDAVLEVQLYVRQVLPESFRQYTLVADNGVASATANVTLLPLERRSTVDNQLSKHRTDYSFQRADDPSEFSRSTAVRCRHPSMTLCHDALLYATTVMLLHFVCFIQR